MKAKVFVDEGHGLDQEQKDMLSRYDSYITFSVPLIVDFNDLAELDNNIDLKDTIDYIFACSNLKFINFFMLRLAKESGRQFGRSTFIELGHSPIEVLSFVHDDSNEKWILVR